MPVTAKASLFRLDSATQAALNNLSRLLRRPRNKLVNEALRQYLLRMTPQEGDIKSALNELEAYRKSNSAAAPPVGEPDASTLDTAREFARRLAKRYRIRASMLFGSRARGAHRADSDADVAIVLTGKRPRHATSTTLELVDIAYEMLLETGLYIQPVPIWEDEWKNPQKHSNPRLLQNIEREGIVL